MLLECQPRGIQSKSPGKQSFPLFCPLTPNFPSSVYFLVMLQVWISMGDRKTPGRHDSVPESHFQCWPFFLGWVLLISLKISNLLYSIKTWKGLPKSLSSKESAYQAGNSCSIPGSGRPPGEGDVNPLQDSCLRNPMERGTWQTIARGNHRRVGHDLVTKRHQ